MLNIEVVGTYEGFLRLETEWKDLLERVGNDSVSLTFEWFNAWWKAFGSDKVPLIMVARENNKTVGIAPLMLMKRKLRWFPIREVSFVENDNSPSADFIIADKHDEFIGAVIERLIEDAKIWDIISFNNIPKDSPTCSSLDKILKKNKLRHGVRPGLRSPFIKINTSWEEYYASRTKKFRKVLRNKVNRIARAGVTYRIVKIENDNKEATSTVYEISKNSWKARCGQSIVDSSSTKQFFDELTRISAQNRWLNIWLLFINDMPVAYEYHLRYGNKLYALRSDYIDEYEESSPGSILDMHIVQKAFEEGISEYDMCGTDNFYKMNWTNTVHEHAKYMIFQERIYGRILYFLEFRMLEFLKKYATPKRLKMICCIAENCLRKIKIEKGQNQLKPLKG